MKNLGGEGGEKQ